MVIAVHMFEQKRHAMQRWWWWLQCCLDWEITKIGLEHEDAGWINCNQQHFSFLYQIFFNQHNHHQFQCVLEMVHTARKIFLQRTHALQFWGCFLQLVHHNLVCTHREKCCIIPSWILWLTLWRLQRQRNQWKSLLIGEVRVQSRTSSRVLFKILFFLRKIPAHSCVGSGSAT